MTIHEHRVSITAAAGSVASTTLNIRGGLMRNFLVRANSSTTIFRANLVDSNSVTRMNYGFHEFEINDQNVSFPMVGTYTLNITNASYDDQFQVVLSIEE